MAKRLMFSSWVMGFVFLFLSATAAFGQATELFFSEYMEGSSNNKALEIYNGTGASVNLASYEIRLFANGASSATSTLTLSGTLTDGKVIYIKHTSATVGPTAAANSNLYLSSTAANAILSFNGDDAIALYKGSTLLDVIGKIGCDPGSAWTGSSSYSTVDRTIRRKSTVCGGITTNPGGTCTASSFPTLNSEWDWFAQDAWDFGHTASCSSSSPEINVKQGTTSLTSGSGSYSFGNQTVSSSSSAVTFTVENTGGATLNLTGTPKVAISGHTGDFSINQTSTTATVAATTGTTTFTVTFSPTTTGTRTATISIANNDSDENPYTFTVTGTGTTPLPACTTPSAATGLTFGTITTSSIAGSFSGSANSYLVIRSTSSTAPTITDGATFTGNATYVVVQDGSGTSFTASGLSANTTYYFYVYAYNNTGCTGGPKYAAALTGNRTTNALPTTVQFTSGSATVTEGTNTTYTLTLSITNPSGSNATSATVSLGSGNARVNGFTSQVVTWAAGDNTNKTVVLTVTNNSSCDGTSNLSFGLGSISGGTSAAAGSQSTFALTVNDDDLTTGIQYGQGFESGGGTSNNWSISSGTGANATASKRTGTYGREMFNGDVDTYADVNITGYTGTVISFYNSGFGGLENADRLEVYVALNGAAFSSTPEVTIRSSQSTSNIDWAYTANLVATKTVNGSNTYFNATSSINAYSKVEITVPDGNTSVAIRIAVVTNGSGEGFDYDDLTLSASYCAAPVPTITTNTTNLNFGNVLVGSNSTLTYTVGGDDLTTPIVVTAPTGYQVSKNGVNFFNSISFTPNNGIVVDSTVTVRFSPVAVTSYSGNITHTSTGAPQVNVSVTGAGVNACTAPLNQATNLVLTPAATSIGGSFTASAGGASGYLVIRHTSSTLGFGPTDGVSYVAGDNIGGGTVVSAASGTTFTATGLSTSTTYYFFIYAYNNTGCAGGPVYKKPYLAGNATTLASPYVMFDNFDRANSTSVGIPSSGGTVAWGEVEAITGLAEIYNNRLDINNTSPQGKAYTVFDMNGRYSTTFDQATSELEWYFNMAQTRPDPSGFGTSNYGVAMVLGATSTSYSTAGDGYAVVLGESGSNDRVKLVKFTGGLTAGTMTDLVADGPNTGGVNGDHLFNIHVKYNPANGTWTLYVNDGGYDPSVTFNFADPTAVTYGSGATVVDQTYTGNNLRYAGALWSYATSSGEFASFDNISIPTAQPCQNSWTGATSTNWFTASNWSCGVVPTTTDNVVIPNTSTGSGRYPVINASLGLTAAVNNLTINTGASVTINANVISGFPVSTNDLEIYGNLTNNGSANWGTGTVTLKGTSTQTVSGNNNFQYLTVQNNANLASGTQKVYGTLALQSGTVTTNGNLVIGSNANFTGLVDEFSSGYTGTLSGTLTVERYTTNTGDAFFYIGAPVGGAQISDWADDFSLATMNGATDGSQVLPTSSCSLSNLQAGSPYGGLFDYRENAVNTCNLEGWHVRTTGSAVQGQGFIARVAPGNTIDLTGTFVTGQTVTRTGLTRRSVNNAPTLPGMNLVSNPFAAPIDWQAVYAANTASVEGTAHFYQTSGPLAGTYVPVNNTIPGSYIGSSQAFIVEARSNNVNLVFNDGMKRNGVNNYLRTAPAYDELITLNVNGNGFADRAYVAFGTAFTTGFDTEFDGRKMMSKPNQPSLYVNDGSGEYSIYAQPNPAQVQIVPVDFVAGTNGTFTIDADLAEFGPTSMVYLEDRLTGTMTNLRMVGSYTFSATTADAAGRFALHFYPGMVVTAENATCAGLDGSINLNQPGATAWELELSDANGDNVFVANNFNGNQTVNNLAPGVYTLNLAHNSGYSVSLNYLVEGPAPVEAGFGAPVAATEGEPVTFTNNSINGSSYTWAFGDGNTSIDANPTHTYTYAGEYLVELTVTNGDCQATSTQTVTVQEKVANGIETINGGMVKIFANGMDINIILANLESVSSVDVFDLTGRKVIETVDLEYVNGNFVITLENAINGYYFVRLNNEKDTFVEKVFVNSGK